MLLSTFTYERDTKNKVRFTEDGDEPVIGTLYMTKQAYKSLGEPNSIVVKIEAV
jgi:hypothetical protein